MIAVSAQRFVPRLGLRNAAIGVALVVPALLVARYLAMTAMPHITTSLYGPYLLAPLGWLAAGGVGLYVYRQLPQPAEAAEAAVNRRTVLLVAALIGAFLVSTQFIVGMLGGFGHSPYAHTPRWLATNLLFAGSIVLAVEFSRAALLRAIGPRSLTLALVLTTLGLAAVQFTDAQLTQSGFSREAQFWGATFIPLAATGLLAGFFVLYGGIPAGLLISAPLVAFQYYSPILPAAEWPILALAGVAGPAMGLWIAEGLFAADEVEEDASGFFRLPSVAWVLTAVIALAIFWFSFGFFGFRPAFVPSHSMEPLINQGDVVLVGPVDANSVKVGDIVLYQMPNKQRVLHRVTAIDRDDKGVREFTFKGDNNNAEDILPVRDDQLMGAYINRVPKIGWVAIKFNQLIGAMR
jgi:signal peptidase